MKHYIQVLNTFNLVILVFFILTVLVGTGVLNANLIVGIITFIQETMIFPITAIVAISIIYAIYLLFTNENYRRDGLLLSALAFLNVIILFSAN